MQFSPNLRHVVGGYRQRQLGPESERAWRTLLRLGSAAAYAELNLPIGNGIDVKIGHFYTIIGYEVVTAPDNFFITKPYTMQYGEPFTHTGVLASYAFNRIGASRPAQSPAAIAAAGTVTGTANSATGRSWVA